ncbi:glycoside hydrolase family 6 protein [Nonomuraea sp. NPDC002799]
MTLDALRDGDPRQVGPYTLLGRLGEGGMGVVYLGTGPDGQRVAVKLIHARMDANADFRRRFAREVAAAQRVARFCTAPVLDADVEGDVAYLVTEYVEGPSLGEAVQASGPLKGSALDGLAASMAMALRAIHGAGVVHRDLKPSNVLLSQVGPKVIDFGIAQLMDAEMSSAIVGTPSYMSPEQVSGATIGPASDIFSWGCTVAFAAGGEAPFGLGSVPTILLRIVNEPPDLRGLSGSLRELVVAALSKSPAARPTAQALMDRLSTATALINLSPASADASGGPSPAGSSDAGATGPGAGLVLDRPPLPDRQQRSTAEDAPQQTSAGPKRATASPKQAEAHSNQVEARPKEPGDGRRRLLAAGAVAVVAVAGVAAALVWYIQSTQDTQLDFSTTVATSGTPTKQVSPGQNPLRAQDDVPLYAAQEPAATKQAVQWEAQGRAADAALMRKLAAVPYAVRLGEPEVRSKVNATITAARQAGGVPVFLVHYLPANDCTQAGAPDMRTYQEWVKGIAGEIGDAPAVIILEPSGLLPSTKDCDTATSQDGRLRDVRQAVRSLKTAPNTAVYLDGGQDYWPGNEITAERLIAAGVDEADGFFVNATGYQRTRNAVTYGKALSACVSVQRRTGRKDCPSDAKVDAATMPHFVVDTSRNGQGAWAGTKKWPDPQPWCNPPGRGVGDRPTTDTGEELADAYLWIARPGVSGGRCRRGTDGEKDPVRDAVSPAVGEWWDVLALERAKNARPALR